MAFGRAELLLCMGGSMEVEAAFGEVDVLVWGDFYKYRRPSGKSTH